MLTTNSSEINEKKLGIFNATWWFLVWFSALIYSLINFPSVIAGHVLIILTMVIPPLIMLYVGFKEEKRKNSLKDQ